MDIVTDLLNGIIYSRKVHSDWQVGSVVHNFKVKSVVEQVMKVVERVAGTLIREQVHVAEIHFEVMRGCDTTDAISLVRQLQEKLMAKRKNLYFVFVDMEKAFHRNLNSGQCVS